jgi:hypothetical protein
VALNGVAATRWRRLFPFLPAALAAVTDLATAALVYGLQGSLPDRVLIFMATMFGAALVFAAPFRWIWVLAFVTLMGGVVLAAWSVGLFYIPTVIAAGWVMVRRFEATF